MNDDTTEKKMLSNANTKPIGGKDLKILDIIHSLENPRLRLGFFQTIHDIENFKIFSTNGFSIVSISAQERYWNITIVSCRFQSFHVTFNRVM